MSLYNMMSTGTSFDSWLTTDTESERYAAAEDKIEERTKELMGVDEKFDYRTFENFTYALGSFSLEEAKEIESYMGDSTADLEKFGRAIKVLVINKLEKWARSEAEDDFEEGKLDD